MFKKGDKVVCIDRDCRCLTYGKHYCIVDKNKELVKIVDDNGDLSNYYSRRFRKFEEEEMFKVGDKVWSCNYGWGTVVEINKTTTYPVLVKFLYGKEEYAFTYDGRILTGEFRTLFFEEIPIPENALKRPRWRADCGGRYYYIKAIGEIGECLDERTRSDNSIYELGNYFKTETEAKESKFYKVFHEEDK